MSSQKRPNVHEGDFALEATSGQESKRMEKLIITKMEVVKMMRYWVKANRHDSNN
ncbi:hypothetical protein KAR91_58060 [Candidatus Pacearchaeota archaeon]|nr:hypothetical protein [Candidatus Pacearchaeota archaeon]